MSSESSAPPPDPPSGPVSPAPLHGASARLSTRFRSVGSDVYEASLDVSLPTTPVDQVKRVILGQPIPETLASRERLNRTRALATLSSDALSSVAYGTEAALAVLVVAGASALSANLGIGLVTAEIMLIVGYSYRQTIYAYPG